LGIGTGGQEGILSKRVSETGEALYSEIWYQEKQKEGLGVIR
jgi:hypothetical protein